MKFPAHFTSLLSLSSSLSSLISSSLLLLLTLCILFPALWPRPAHANPPTDYFPILGLDVGWEDMLTDGAHYEQNNSGLMFTLALGLNLTKIGDMYSGFQIEQDLGFIDLRLKGDPQTGTSPSSEKLFKGATLAGVNGMIELPTPGFFSPRSSIIFVPKLSVGAVYMKTPEDAEKSIQPWFAVRPSVSLSIWPDKLPLIGLEFDYTLGISTPNVFDNQRITHFVSLKLKVWI